MTLQNVNRLKQKASAWSSKEASPSVMPLYILVTKWITSSLMPLYILLTKCITPSAMPTRPLYHCFKILKFGSMSMQKPQKLNKWWKSQKRSGWFFNALYKNSCDGMVDVSRWGRDALQRVGSSPIKSKSPWINNSEPLLIFFLRPSQLFLFSLYR